MKTRTRILAWIYIIPCLPGAILACLLGILAVFAILLGESSSGVPTVYERAIGLVLSIGIFGVLMFSELLLAVPWIYLLKQRAWAWWILTVGYLIITPLLFLVLAGDFTPSNNWLEESGGLLIFTAISLLTLLLLFTDGPNHWKARRSARKTSRRRAKRSRR